MSRNISRKLPRKETGFQSLVECGQQYVMVTLNNASDYRANGLLLDYIEWTNGLKD